MKKNKQEKHDKAYLEMAKIWGQLSYCERKKVMVIMAHRLDLKIFVKMRNIIPNGMFFTQRQMQF